MPNRTNIGWTDYTSNPIMPTEGGWGCSKVSSGCDHCYAETLNKHYGNRRDFKGKWEFVLKYSELEKLCRLPIGTKVFLGNMTDLFHPNIPWEMLLKLFNFMAGTDWITYQILTKRPGRMAYFAEHIWPPNIWAGTSVESQKYVPRLDCLARVPAKVRFVSVEPMLGPIDLWPWLVGHPWEMDPAKGLEGRWDNFPDYACFPAINWVIVGGESGFSYRAMEVSWVESLRDQCQITGVPLFVKQDAGPWPGRQGKLPDDLWRLKEIPVLTT